MFKIVLIILILLTAFCLISSVNAANSMESDLSDTTILTENLDNEITESNDLDDKIAESNDLDDEITQAVNSQSEISDEATDNNNQDIVGNSQLESSTNIYVSNAGSDVTGDGSENNPYQTIKHAVSKSNDNGNIFLKEGNYTGENNRNITIDKSITINGKSSENTKIDAQYLSRIFELNSDVKLTLNKLTLINGFEEGNGGSIFNNGGEIIINNSKIENSHTDTDGGAIYSNGTLSIENSIFNNNSAYTYGGVIYSIGNLNVKDTNFTNNFLTSITTAVGGCVLTVGTSNFYNCYFDKNHAQYSSGAISCYGNAHVNYCSFINQTTNYTGGAISNHGLLIINNSHILDCYSLHYAAAIINPPPPEGETYKIEAYNTIFEKNHVEMHGAVSNNYNDSELYMENCAIIGNYILKDNKKGYGDISLDKNATTLYCWWGQNQISEYYYSPHSDAYTPEKINASKWLVMTFTSSNDVIKQEENNVLTVSLRNYFDNETKETHKYDGDLNLPLSVRIYEGNGNTIGVYKLVNGTVSINYTPKDNTKALFANINNQTIRIPVKQKTATSITANDITKYYKVAKSLEVQLKDANNSLLSNKVISITLNKKTYNLSTDSNGKVKLDITNLGTGSYNAVISFAGDDEYKKISKDIKITVLKNKTSIVASNLVKYYKNATKLSIKLVDNNKKPLKSKTVKIKIAGKTYSRITNSKGIATLAIKNKVGAYSVKISFNGDKLYQKSSKTIKVYVKSAKMTSKTKKIHRKSYFVATFKDKSGKAIKKTKVKFKLNGKTYTKTTNKKGIAKLKINVKIGTYKIKASFKSTKLYGATVFTKKIKVIK